MAKILHCLKATYLIESSTLKLVKIAKHVTSKHVTCDISQGLELPFTKKNLHVYLLKFLSIKYFQ